MRSAEDSMSKGEVHQGMHQDLQEFEIRDSRFKIRDLILILKHAVIMGELNRRHAPARREVQAAKEGPVSIMHRNDSMLSSGAGA